MNGRILLLVLTLTLLSFAVPAQALGPTGPRLALSVFGDGPGAEDEFSNVITVGPAGEAPETILHGPWVGDGLSWSGDGNRLAFSAVGVESAAAGAFGSGWPVVGLLTLDAEDVYTSPQGFLNGGDPVLAPDGRTVVFSRAKLVKVLAGRESYLFKSALWSLDVASGSVRRLVPWRLMAFFEPIGFSPDGSGIVTELLDRRGHRIVAIDLDSRRSTRLARLPDDASEPIYSAGGDKLAFVRARGRRFSLPKPDRPVSELWVANADGSAGRRLLRRGGYISFPSWDPSGSRIAFTRNPPEEATGALEPEPGNKVMAINVDGTCLTRVFTDPELTVHDVAWQPGPGREAGLISC